MAKEITHLVVAHDVLKQMESTGQRRLARLIADHKEGFFLGAVIPDAVFYDVPPFQVHPLRHAWIARALHDKEATANIERAVSFFRMIPEQPSAWRLKLAFFAGVVTHTVADRVFHDAIETYTALWGETGHTALATHRQIETLVDIVLLEELGMAPRDFLRQHLTPCHKGTRRLCRLFVSSVAGGRQDCGPHPHMVLSRAHQRQQFFLGLFALRPLQLAVNCMDRIAGGRLQPWCSLFYPGRADAASFPVIGKFQPTSPDSNGRFAREATRLRKTAVEQALESIQAALANY